MMSEQVEKSKIGHERSQIITEANHERVLGKVYKKAKEEKKREKEWRWLRKKRRKGVKMKKYGKIKKEKD